MISNHSRIRFESPAKTMLLIILNQKIKEKANCRPPLPNQKREKNKETSLIQSGNGIRQRIHYT